jgi:hypothetical protein
MGQMHNSGQAVKRTFGICRAHSDKPMGMPRAKRRNTNRREAYTNRIRKGINRIRIRIGNSMCLSGGLIELKLSRKRNARMQLVGGRGDRHERNRDLLTLRYRDYSRPDSETSAIT